jgi:hypothetical protein
MTIDSKDQKRDKALSLLDDLANELDKGFIEEEVTVSGLRWTLRTLQDHERNWAAGYTVTKSVTAMLHSVKAPTLSIAIRAINGVPVKEFFLQAWLKESETPDPQLKEILNAANEYVRQYYFAERLYMWLSARPAPGGIVDNLWTEWTKLENRREAADAAMGKSLPVDGSSPPTATTSSSAT